MPVGSTSRRARIAERGSAVGCLVAFALVVALRATGAADAFDRQAVVWLCDRRFPLATALMHVVTWAGDGWALFAVVVGVAALWWRTRPGDVRFLVACGVGAGVASVVGKALAGRARPDAALRLVEAASTSFPSGHALGSSAVYVGLGLLIGSRTAISASVLLAAGVGLSRVYLGVHYPTDVLAGWMLGAAWATGLRGLTTNAHSS